MSAARRVEDDMEQQQNTPLVPWDGGPVDVAGLTRIRLREPSAVAQAWHDRRRLTELPAGKMLVVAADHPARGALAASGDPRAMESRSDLLFRLATAITRPGVTGVLGTPDILEDLLLMGLLDDKLLVGSMNRGGITGGSFEIDDRFTAYNAAAMAARGVDVGKMLLRVDLSDAGTAEALEACGRAVSELAAHHMPAMVEPFWSRRDSSGAVRNQLDPESVIKSIHVGAGLGDTSAYTWLKLPVVDEMERVLDATTMPVVLLGGDPSESPDEVYASWADALAFDNAVGLVVGRTLLYPREGDVAAAVDIAAEIARKHSA